MIRATVPDAPSEPGCPTAIDDAVWGAMNDPTRRQILDLLRERSRSTGELAECFPVSRFAVMKHLKVLELAGLIVVERRGRVRTNHLNPVPLQQIYRRWIKPFERLSADRLLRLKAIAERNQENDQ